jgi:DNA-binding transcriptional LysR family regulator
VQLLINRSNDAGERLLSQLRPLLDGFDAAIESVIAFREKPAGHLRLTMPLRRGEKPLKFLAGNRHGSDQSRSTFFSPYRLAQLRTNHSKTSTVVALTLSHIK